MANSLYQQLNNAQNMGNANLPEVINKFNQFRQSFQGDPQQVVQQLLNSGRMSQAQYNQLRGMAQQFMKFLGR